MRAPVVVLLVVFGVMVARSEARVANPRSVAPEEGSLFEGDIILQEKGRDLPSEVGELWPNGVFYYDFSTEFDFQQQQFVESAILDLQQNTCVHFKRWKNWMKNQTYVKFRNVGTICAAAIGYFPQLEYIELFLGLPGCASRGTIQHEILHSLGFWHEHTRPDRDQHVQILWQNIAPGRQSNFEARPSSPKDKGELPYDYHSVMHYRALAFSKDASSFTILPHDRSALYAIGQRYRFSPMDLKKLNKLYGCQDPNRL